ncbi:MAG: hypothetical protein WAQ25_02540 [Candidatus Saccharimonas sp.]
MKYQFKTALVLGAGVATVVGLVVAPLSADAIANSSTTTVNATINPVITISSGPTVGFTITPTATGMSSSSSDTVSVSTNRSNGYNLKLEDNDASSNLVSGANNITPTSGTFAAPASMATANTWGYRVDGAGTFGAGPTSAETDVATLAGTWAAVPVLGSPNTIKTTASPGTSTTTVWYGAKANTSIPDGVYSDVVKYTATTN